MQKNLVCGGACALMACLAALTLGGCGGGGSSPSYRTVGGTVFGLGADESVVLLDNGKDALSITADGSFVFPSSVATGSTYDVTVQSHPPGISCTVSNGTGTVSTNVTQVVVICTAGTETILHSFGTGIDGYVPAAGLTLGPDGNLYGTTSNGTNGIMGTVFKISPAGQEVIVFPFYPNHGEGPQAGLVFDGAGNLYGNTTSGGANGMGIVFKLSPSGSETILYSFGSIGTDGDDPDGRLIRDSAGNLYGTTAYGGTNDEGVVFKISAAGTETVLYSFGRTGTDGQLPSGGLVMDRAGNLYGTTTYGGTSGEGTVFKISPSGSETILHSFGSIGNDGASPDTGLIMDSAGNLYGNTAEGGANYTGTVFKLSPSGSETILYSFGSVGTDGDNPDGRLIRDSVGNLYGTTLNGGTNGVGTVFKISPAGAETVLHSFGNVGTDGQNPSGRLVMDSAGNLYGTTQAGGANSEGTVFKIN